MLIYLGWNVLLTLQQIRRINYFNEIKEKENAPMDAVDRALDSELNCLKLALGCAFAAVLAGSTGIAGGMVLAPLFMSYDMLPEVVSGTN